MAPFAEGVERMVVEAERKGVTDVDPAKAALPELEKLAPAGAHPGSL